MSEWDRLLTSGDNEMTEYLKHVKEYADTIGCSYCQACMYAGGVCQEPCSCELYNDVSEE